MKIEAYIICWNEAKILPWVLQYWHAAGIDKLIVYDNGSTDDTLAILEDFPLCTEVRHYDSGGEANDWIYADIKNNCWKGTDADWVFVGDTDEVLFAPVRLKEYLKGVKAPILQPCLYQLVAWALPRNYYRTETPGRYGNGMQLLHEYDEVRLQKLGPNKINFFQPGKVEVMAYELGAHKCHPRINIKADGFGDPVPLEYRENLSWFHLKNLGVEYLLQRNAELYARLPQKVKDEGRIACHYLPGTDVHNVAAGLADIWADAKPFTAFDTLL